MKLRQAWQVVHAKVFKNPTVALSGPGIADLVRHVAEDIATSIHDGDARAGAWSDYVLATSNLANAMEGDADRHVLDQLEEALADAWNRLAADLPSVVWLTFAEGRLVAEQIDNAVGRVGSEWRAA
jgi:hypothetical protein